MFTFHFFLPFKPEIGTDHSGIKIFPSINILACIMLLYISPTMGINFMSTEIKQTTDKPAKSAFTLIEVLIAMFISVMAVSSTYMLINHSRDILRSSSNRIEALNNARTAMEYVRSLNFDSDKLEVGKTYTPTVGGLTFWYNVTKYDGKDALKQISVRADWTSELSDAVRQIELVTVISAPLHSE